MSEGARGRSTANPDQRFYLAFAAPTAAAFWLLAVALEGSGWLYALGAVGGWLVSSLTWWQLYAVFVLKAATPSRLRFYLACMAAHAALIGGVVVWIAWRYAA